MDALLLLLDIIAIGVVVRWCHANDGAGVGAPLTGLLAQRDGTETKPGVRRNRRSR